MPSVKLPNRAAPATEFSAQLPLIDVSEESLKVGQELVAAAAKWGFLWIVASDPSEGKGLDGSTEARQYDFDETILNKMFTLSRKFFLDASLEEKQAVSIKNDRGWVDMHVENLDPSKHKRGDFKQAFNMAEPVNGVWRQPMPVTFLAQDEDLKDFHQRCRNLSTRILRLLAMGLDIPDLDWLTACHEPGSEQTTRFLYYPSLPADTDYDAEEDIRAGAHSDYGSITLLFQRPSQSGLEILTPEGTWAAVPVFPPNYHSSTLPPVLVNIGDLLSYWTNGLLRSTVHRVVLPNPAPGSATRRDRLGEDRFSIACFVDPFMDTELVPMPSPLVASRAARFAADEGQIIGHGGGATKAGGMHTLTAGEHMSNRLRATYGAVYQPGVKAGA